MDSKTKESLIAHAKTCGCFEVTVREEFELGVDGPWRRVYQCRKCCHKVQEILRDVNGDLKRKSA